MTLMKLSALSSGLPAAGFEPVGWGEARGLTGHHAGQTGEHVGEVFFGINPEAAAVFYNGVEDGALLTGLLIADEQPVLSRTFWLGSKLGLPHFA